MTKEAFCAKLRQLEIGKSLEEPVERRSYVSSACSRFSLEWGKTFTTRTNRERRVVVVTRIA